MTTEPDRSRETVPTGKVLYIDDDYRLRQLAVALLGELGMTVDVAETGAQGLEMLRSGQYDVVLTDFEMPGMNGGEVTRLIKQHWPDTPVIVVTGWTVTRVLDQLDKEVMPDLVLAKPFTRAALRRALESVRR